MDKLSDIELAIEHKRSELNRAGNKYGYHSKIVLKISQELDYLLNKYDEKRSAAI
ncbi:aspartyl-phosphate phosphatase Spo0E family protein [Bacillus cereus]|nr:aspartyl-phosphate phosphatase Spo0E family protein [Bacillus cereus]